MGQGPSPANAAHPATTAIILAGGRGSRLGGRDKGTLWLGNAPLICHVRDTIAPQVDRILVSANRSLEWYLDLGLTVVPDLAPGYAGPLAGILAGMQADPASQFLVVPCDCPSPPRALRHRLQRCQQDSGRQLCVAHDGNRLQPLFALIQRDLRADLQRRLAEKRFRVADWVREHQAATADFSDQPEGFTNINTPEDLQRACQALRSRHQFP